MNSATITFDDGTQIIVTEDTNLIGIHNIGSDEVVFTTNQENKTDKNIIEIGTHNEDDVLIPAILDMFLKYDFFSIDSSSNLVYPTKSVINVKSNVILWNHDVLSWFLAWCC